MKILLAAGGTGGHLIPALNIADYLYEHCQPANIFFAGTNRGLSSKLVPTDKYKLFIFDIDPLYREFSIRLLISIKKLIISLFKFNKLLKEVAPDVIIGTASYISGPPILLGAIRGIPTVIQEQNSIPGLTTKLLSLFTDKICLAYEKSLEHIPLKSKAIITGNPVNIESPTLTHAELMEKYNLNSALKTILVTGGSQGAQSINLSLLKLIHKYKINESYNLIWLTGTINYERIKTQLGTTEQNIWMNPFTNATHNLYSLADIVVSRAGALTLAETALWGLPAILIPYPYAAANHQYFNALTVKEKGAAEIIEDKCLSAELLQKKIINILTNNELYNTMCKESKKLANENSTRYISEQIIKLARSK